ncbi:hypothetical protein [Nocardia sp. NRRL S-836]|uniref:hypothetical protein n=1 Tax=Nocardia sp. NRRL S-836 TaxID=1519492 RepID=UPI0006AE0AA6|nr:hypothetical protein [Nocardia sp. NRRL S-836]KOV81251.1 hypothetical protein ADL03_29485 [Nocardia sp. NRRL S-836]
MSPEVSNVFTGSANTVAQTGHVYGDVHFHGGWQAPQDFTGMLEPREVELLGRERELRRLRDFCHGPDPYLWVRAKSWSGKSALLKEFARREHEGLSLVWYFARRGHSNDRADFVRVVWHQLAALLGEGVPADTRLDRYGFRALLARAAELCEGTLVLLVDGLDEEADDEDGGIVHLLPARPPAGLRVVLSSRWQRPLPERVLVDEPGHPLLSPDVVWPLPPSEHATVMRSAAHKDLRALTRGTKVEKSLLGYVTAAARGLTVRDLAELLDVFDDEVAAVLEGLTGRSFAQAQSLWRPGHVRYFLDHPSLQEEAEEKIGDQRLAKFTRKLRKWARKWRDRGWPVDTPEYLLLDHPAEDRVRLALDPARHVRLRALTGANVLALKEIAAAQEELADGRDLAALAKLAVLRDDLDRHTAVIPPELPVVWAGLGHLARAESLIAELPARDRVKACAAVLARAEDTAVAGKFRALAESSLELIDVPEVRGTARADLALALIAAGDLDAAQSLAEQAGPEFQTVIHEELIAAAWAVGDRARAEAVCAAATTLKRKVRLVTAAAVELAARGRYAEAAEFVNARIEDKYAHAEAMAGVVCAVADRDPDQALEIVRGSRKSVRYRQVKGDVAIAVALHRRGRSAQARARLELAETRISGKILPTWYDGAVNEIVRGWVVLGDPGRAVRLGRSLRGPDTRGRNLVSLVDLLVRAGFHGHASELARTACADLATVVPLSRRTEGHLELVRAVAHLGDPGLTSAIASKARAAVAALHPATQPAALAAIALARDATSSPDRRAGLVAELPDQGQRRTALIDLALELAEADDLAGALRVVARVPDPAAQAEVLTVLAAGVPEQAQRLAEAAEAAARATTDGSRSKVRAQVARALLRIGRPTEALAVARPITDPYLHATTLSAIADAVAPAEAERIACEITYPYYRVRALAAVMSATTDPRHADALLAEARCALPSVDADWQLAAHTFLAVATARALGVPAADELVGAAEKLVEDAAAGQANGVRELATAVAGFGQHHRAARIARCIHDVALRCRALSEVAVITAAQGEVTTAAEFAGAVRVMAIAIGDAEERARALTAADEADAACSAPATAHRSPQADPPPAPSRQELAGQLTGSTWTGALPALADVDPDALCELADALPRLYR